MRRPHDLNKAYSLLVNREIARRLRSDPVLIEEARRAVAEMIEPHQKAAAALWSKLLDQPLEVIAATLSQDDEEGDFVRETRPPFIVLDPGTRMLLLEEARHLFAMRM